MMENVCGRGDNNCGGFLEESEEAIEQWWADSDNVDPEKLWQHLCVDEMKVCCNDGHFGKSCKPCPGGADKPCSNHGSCSGSGTRGGKGKCKCNAGYSGKKCQKCKAGYFLMGAGASEEMQCVKCDGSCKHECTGPGNEFCAECADGYEKSEEGKCLDVDECATGTFKCDQGKYCSNTPGNYTCTQCDRSCHPDDGCTAAGPKGCAEKSCADGFEYDDEVGCADVDECLKEGFCEIAKYCYNRPGTATCLPCSTACDKPLGCVNGTAEGCNGCTTGYARIDGAELGCKDIDECAEGKDGNPACNENYTCRNTRGAHECNCVPPHFIVGAGDAERCAVPPPDDANGSEVDGKAADGADAAAPAKDEL